MKLITMTEFVLLQKVKLSNGTLTTSDYVERTGAYARFLIKPISMNMFVPVDQLREIPGGEKSVPAKDAMFPALFPELDDKVLFKDLTIEYTDISKKYHIKKKDGCFVITGTRGMFDNNLRIEDLVHRELELTDTAVKLIFG